MIRLHDVNFKWYLAYTVYGLTLKRSLLYVSTLKTFASLHDISNKIIKIRNNDHTIYALQTSKGLFLPSGVYNNQYEIVEDLSLDPMSFIQITEVSEREYKQDMTVYNLLNKKDEELNKVLYRVAHDYLHLIEKSM